MIVIKVNISPMLNSNVCFLFKHKLNIKNFPFCQFIDASARWCQNYCYKIKTLSNFKTREATNWNLNLWFLSLFSLIFQRINCDCRVKLQVFAGNLRFIRTWSWIDPDRCDLGLTPSQWRLKAAVKRDESHRPPRCSIRSSPELRGLPSLPCPAWREPAAGTPILQVPLAVSRSCPWFMYESWSRDNSPNLSRAGPGGADRGRVWVRMRRKRRWWWPEKWCDPPPCAGPTLRVSCSSFSTTHSFTQKTIYQTSLWRN